MFVILMCSCHRNKTFHSIDTFRDTPVWQLAQFVRSQDTIQMRQLIEANPSINIDHEDSKYHKNLLIWAIFNGRHDSAEALLRMGADPNFTSFDGTTPLIYASKYMDSNYKSDVRYIAILLQFGADPNKITRDSVSELERNALNAAAVTSIENVKYLIEIGGADPLIKVNNISPVEEAVIQNQLEIVDYLVSSFEISLHIPSGTYGGGKTVLDILMDKTYPRNSDLYTLQQKLIKMSPVS